MLDLYCPSAGADDAALTAAITSNPVKPSAACCQAAQPFNTPVSHSISLQHCLGVCYHCWMTTIVSPMMLRTQPPSVPDRHPPSLCRHLHAAATQPCWLWPPLKAFRATVFWWVASSHLLPEGTCVMAVGHNYAGPFVTCVTSTARDIPDLPMCDCPLNKGLELQTLQRVLSISCGQLSPPISVTKPSQTSCAAASG